MKKSLHTQMPKPIEYIQVAPQGRIQVLENGSDHQSEKQVV